MIRIRSIAVLLLAALLVCSTALAGQGSPRAHDGGFMIRMAAGFGAGNTSIPQTNTSPELELDGAQGDIEIAIGGVVRENLALHGTLFGFTMADPDAKLSGVDGQFHGSITMSGVGGGLTWWVMPANFYFSGTLGVGLLSVEPDVGSSASTDTGFAAQVSLGKEWWVGDSWGLGVAGGFTYHNVPDGDVEENWSGTSFSIRFSATYN